MKTIFGQQTTKLKQLADRISQDISMGVYRPGDSLPSINQLSKSYDVSRDTVFKAFIDLKERGLIDSTPGKGYFVVGKLTNVLLLLDEYSPFKNALYNALVKRLSLHYKVDLLFHQYNERLFNTILRESLGRYNKYLVMNFDNEKFSAQLYKIDSSRLLLLDFGKFDKKEYAYVCQDFDSQFYDALVALHKKLSAYRRITFFLVKESKHPRSSKEYFEKFCSGYNVEGTVSDDIEGLTVTKGEVYIVTREQDVVTIMKKSREAGLRCGEDFGLIAYNDMPVYEVIDQGITSITIDWELMGEKAADFVLDNVQVREYLPTVVRVRHSL